MATILRVENLKKAFQFNGSEIVALEDVTLDVAESEFVAILGPSGCGKSTLLQIIAGLQTATSGKVELRGEAVTEPPVGLVYLFQQYSKSLMPWRTNISNVAFPLAQTGLSRKELKATAAEYLRMVGLTGFEDHYPWQLSGGMQQRVAIARALAVKPKVLLLDEPFSAVDALTRIELQSLVLDICAAQKLTCVLVTHDVEEAVYMANRIVILSKRPTVVSEVHDAGLPETRDPVTTREMPRFIELRRLLLDRLLERGVPSGNVTNA